MSFVSSKPVIEENSLCPSSFTAFEESKRNSGVKLSTGSAALLVFSDFFGKLPNCPCWSDFFGLQDKDPAIQKITSATVNNFFIIQPILIVFFLFQKTLQPGQRSKYRFQCRNSLYGFVLMLHLIFLKNLRKLFRLFPLVQKNHQRRSFLLLE